MSFRPRLPSLTRFPLRQERVSDNVRINYLRDFPPGGDETRLITGRGRKGRLRAPARAAALHPAPPAGRFASALACSLHLLPPAGRGRRRPGHGLTRVQRTTKEPWGRENRLGSQAERTGRKPSEAPKQEKFPGTGRNWGRGPLPWNGPCPGMAGIACREGCRGKWGYGVPCGEWRASDRDVVVA